MGILRRIITTETAWCTLIFYVLSGSITDAQTNVAFNKPATQSNTYIRPEDAYGGGPSGPRVAEIAVDGDPLPAQCVNVSNHDGLWSHTLKEPNSWWMVDLGKQYYIYVITVCNRGQRHGFRLDGAQLLFSIEESITPSDPDPRDTNNWRIIDTISVNTLDLIQIPEQPEEISVARHVAIFNADPDSVTLREVTVAGFTDEEKDAIFLNHRATMTAFNITLTANINGFNSTVFAPSRLKLYNHTDGNRIELEDIFVSDGTEVLQIVLPDLTPQSNFSFEIELISNQFLLATKSFQLSTPGFIREVDQPTTSGEFEENGSQGGLPSGAVTGIIISTAVIAGVITVIVVSFLLKKKRLKQQELADKDDTKSKNLRADEPRDYEDLHLGSQSAYKAGLDLEDTPNSHDYAKLDVQHNYESATSNALPTTDDHHYTTMDSQYEMLSSPNTGDAHVYAVSTPKDSKQLSEDDDHVYTNYAPNENYENID